MAARSHAAVLLVLCTVLWSTGGLLIKWTLLLGSGVQPC
jgi:hypothetical protein